MLTKYSKFSVFKISSWIKWCIVLMAVRLKKINYRKKTVRSAGKIVFFFLILKLIIFNVKWKKKFFRKEIETISIIYNFKMMT